MSMYVRRGSGGLLRAPTGGMYACTRCPCGPTICTTKCEKAPDVLHFRIRATWSCPTVRVFDTGEFVVAKSPVSFPGTEHEFCSYETESRVAMPGGDGLELACRLSIGLWDCWELVYGLYPAIWFYYPACLDERGNYTNMAESGAILSQDLDDFLVWYDDPVAISAEMRGGYVGHQGAWCTYEFIAALGCEMYAPPYTVSFEAWEE